MTLYTPEESGLSNSSNYSKCLTNDHFGGFGFNSISQLSGEILPGGFQFTFLFLTPKTNLNDY